MNIKGILSKAVNEYGKACGDVGIANEHGLYAESEWDDIELADRKRQHIYYLSKRIDNRLPYFVPQEIMPYVCSLSNSNYADPKHSSYKDEVGTWNEDFVYIWVPGALPFVVTDFLGKSRDYDHVLYRNVRYIVPLCVNDMEIWNWQKQEDTAWLPKGKNDRDTIWKVIGYCVNKRISLENGDNNPECEEMNEEGD